MDCHGAARLAMTQGCATRDDEMGRHASQWREAIARLAMAQRATRLAVAQGLRSADLAQQTPGGDVLG